MSALTITDISNFIAQYHQEKDKALIETRQTAPAYNIFRVLRVTQKEKQHSNFLAHLLSPSSSHGQRHLFLKTFLETCCKGYDDFPQPSEVVSDGYWEVATEFSTIYGRMDIVLRSPDLGYLCVIENKIYTGEQHNQLDRYNKWMKEQREIYPDQALIYLTPHGGYARKADSLGVKYYRLSYRENINNWLKSVLEADQHVVAPNVRVIISQYINLVQQI